MAKRNQKKNRSATRSGGSGSSPRAQRTDGDGPRRPALRTSTETKNSRGTSELVAYVALVLAVVMAALAVDADGRGGEDPFGAQEALLYITVLTVGYMLARGAAKASSHRRPPVRRRHDAPDHLLDDHDASEDHDASDERDAPAEQDPSDAHADSDESSVHVDHAPARATAAEVVDDTAYLLPAPDGHTHQDGHAHVPGHPHDDGHVHGEVVSQRG